MGNWYVFYNKPNTKESGQNPPQVETMRISASCLGDAETVAIETAKLCGLLLIGIAPDIVSNKAIDSSD